MTPGDRLRCERECTRLCNDFAWSVDTRDHDGFVGLFAADGVFMRGGQRSVGHEAIRAFLDARPADRVTRHICTNIRIEMTGAANATGTSSALMFHASAPAPAALPLPAAQPLVVDYADDYVLTQGGWKFARRSVTIVFQP